MEYPFEYCALRYLLLWGQEEKKLHNGMTGSEPTKVLHKALHYFRVSRSFKGIGDGQKATQILNAVVDIGENSTLEPENKVMNLAKRFQGEFDRLNVSAASKLLWLRYRHPFVIYDARAVSTLQKQFDHDFDKGDYVAYWKAWHEEYGKHQGAVKEAAARLKELQPFVSTWHQSEGSLTTMAQEPWFLERVFDIYLWECGGKNG
ncbi:MAG: hypothetical protein HZA46_15120 [Planctomycetales bacterium]|nr:hypothetical protein [Planctomycetales bacterium]